MLRLSFHRYMFTGLSLLSLLFAGCDRKPSSSQQESPTVSALPSVQAQPPQSIANKQSVLSETPQETCGDALPKDDNAYPVSFYPVYVDYDEKSLELVKKHFCEDALKKVREKTGKDVVQVASFTSLEKANQFKQKLSQHFSGTDVGDPTIIESKPNTQVASREARIKAARLTHEQANELDKKVGIGHNFVQESVVVVPGYLPEGFQVVQFVVNTYSREQMRQLRLGGNIYKQNFAGRYNILYSNNEGRCFKIEGGIKLPIGDFPYEYPKTVKLKTSALGNVEIGYDVFDRGDEIRSINIQRAYALIKGANSYRFFSASYTDYFTSSDGSSKQVNCKTMKLKDAVKVIQSIQFLNP